MSFRKPIRLPVFPRGGQGEPYGDDVVALARELVEGTCLTQREIGRRIGVSHFSVCRWARAGDWRRPPGAARPFDEAGWTERARENHALRTLPWRRLAAAEALVATLPDGDLDGIERAVALVVSAWEVFDVPTRPD